MHARAARNGDSASRRPSAVERGQARIRVFRRGFPGTVEACLRTLRHRAVGSQAQSRLRPAVAPAARAQADIVRTVSRISVGEVDGDRKFHQLDFHKPHQIFPRVASLRSFPHSCGDCRWPAGRLAPRLRIWSAGCSSGEEPYTIAAVLARDNPRYRSHDMRMLATDIDTDILAKAAHGEYAGDRARRDSGELSEVFRRRRAARSHRSRHRDEMRELIAFRQLNLMEPVAIQGPVRCHLLPQRHDLFRRRRPKRS